MSKVNEYLIELTEQVIKAFHLSDDLFDEVQEIIQDKFTGSNVIDYFEKNIICPHCLSFLGPKCTCQQELIKKIDKQLKPLNAQLKKLEKQTTFLYAQKKDLKNQIDLDFIKTIPEDLSKITNQQWSWILFAGHVETEAQFEFQNKILRQIGFNRSGFRPETNQVAVMISQYGLKIDKLNEGFEYLKKHLSPLTVEDKRHKTGICIEVTGLDDSYRSVIYIHKNETVALYKSSYDQGKEFKTFKDFLNWYSIALLEIEKRPLPF